jgi:uncharacterized protein YndB with AHSA1/START domain
MSTEKSITVHRDIPAPANDVFAVLSNPARHVELDGSGFVQGVDHADRVTATGQSFRMNMSGDHMGGDYQTDNVVSGFESDKLIAWKTAPAGTEPPGWEWVWELQPQGPDSTLVSLTYNWEKVTDRNLLSKVSFPLVSEDQLNDSLNRLAAAVSGS